MKKLLVSALMGCLIACVLVSSVSAQLPYFTVNFDRVNYDMGSQATVAINILTDNQAFDIREMGIQLYFMRDDGSFFVTPAYVLNYTDNLLQLAANDNVTEYVDFNVPQRSDLISGQFSYTFYAYIREQGTTAYSYESTDQLDALSYGSNCVLQGSDITPSPNPTTEPTPTPSPTPTPTPTPTLTPTPTPTSTPTPIGFLTAEVLIGIGAVITVIIIVIIVIMLKKRRK